MHLSTLVGVIIKVILQNARYNNKDVLVLLIHDTVIGRTECLQVFKYTILNLRIKCIYAVICEYICILFWVSQSCIYMPEYDQYDQCM